MDTRRPGRASWPLEGLPAAKGVRMHRPHVEVMGAASDFVIDDLR